MTAVIAEAYIRLRPKSEGFKSEADAQIERSKPSDVSVDVKADTSAAKERLDALRVSLDDLKAKAATARVGLDGDVKAQSALDKIDFSLRRLGVTTAKPSITVEGAERAKIQLDEIEARLRTVGATTARPNVTGGGSGGIFNRLAGYSSSGGFFAPKGLAGLAVFGAPAALPLAAGAAGFGAGLLAPTVAGGLGLGLFGAAAKADITRIDKVQTQIDTLNKKIAATPQTLSHTTTPATAAQLAAAEARVQQAAAGHSVSSYLSAQASLASLQARGGTTTRANPAYDKLVKQRTALLDQLSAPERAATAGIEKLEKTWVRFQKELEPQTFKLVASGTDIATKGLNLMLPAVKDVGDVLDALAGKADKALGDPFWKQFFGTFLTSEAPRAVNTLGTVVGNVITGFAHLSEDFAPLGHRVEDDLVRWSGLFDKWTQGSGPGQFVAIVEKDGPVAAKALGALADGTIGLAKGLEPIGRIELQALTPVLDFVGDLGKQHPEVITALGVAYLSVAGGLKAITAVKGLSGVVGVITGLGRVGKPGGITGGGGGGGILGRFGAQGSTPANPLYVFVVDEKPGGGIKVPGIFKKGGGAGAAEAGAEDASKLAKLGKFGGPALGIAAGLLAVETETPKSAAPVVPQAQREAANRNPQVMKIYSQLLAQYQTAHPFDFSNVAQAGLLRQAIAEADAEAAQGGTAVGTTFSVNVGKGIRAKLGPAASNDSRIALGQIIQTAERIANDGGSSIGAALDAGLTVGINQGRGKVEIVTKQMIDGVLHVAKNTAQITSPSKVTTSYGRFIAEGLAVGFTGYTADLLAAFSGTTQTALDRIGLQVNKAAAKYQQDAQARTSAATGIAGNLTGGYNLTNAFGPYGNVLPIGTFLGGGATTLHTELGLLNRLKSKHLSSELLAEIAQASPQQGVALATNILSGKSGSIATLNRDQAAIDRYAGQIGATVAGAQYAATMAADIKAMRSAFTRLAQVLEHAGKLTPAEYNQFGAAVAKALQQVVRGIQVHG